MKIIKLLLFLGLLFLATDLSAQSSADLNKRKLALTKEIEALDRSLKQTSTNKRLSQKQINELNTKIRLRQEKINTINTEIRMLDKQITENTNTIRSLQSQLNSLKKEYKGMVLFAFRNRSAQSKLMFVFAAKDFNQAYKRLQYLKQFSQHRKRKATTIVVTQKNLGVEINQLDHSKKDKASLLQDEEKEKQAQVKAKEDQAKKLNKLARQEKQFKQELTKKQQEAKKLNNAIQVAIAKEMAAAKKAAEAAEKKKPTGTAKPVASGSKVLAATPESAKLSADFLGNQGKLPWPVTQGVIVEQFGRHIRGNVTTTNNGVDIKTNPGAAVTAIFAGDVIRVMSLGGTKFVMLKHGEYFSVYSNLRTTNVTEGQKVSIKQTVGTVATDPLDGTTQAHLEIWKGASPVNPQSWLAR